MEDEDAKRGEIQMTNLLHSHLESKKYKRSYELFWSEKFKAGIINFKNRDLTGALKKTKGQTKGEDDDNEVPLNWINIKDTRKCLTREQMMEASSSSLKKLLYDIDTSRTIKIFEEQMNIDDEIPKDSYAETQNPANYS